MISFNLSENERWFARFCLAEVRGKYGEKVGIGRNTQNSRLMYFLYRIL